MITQNTDHPLYAQGVLLVLYKLWYIPLHLRSKETI